MPLTRSDGAFDWPGLFRFPERLLSPHDEHPIRIEEFMDGDVLVIRCELPDVEVADVELSAHGPVLRVRAERRERHRPAAAADAGEYRSEFRYGWYGRTLTLPPGFDGAAATVAASTPGGVVEVRVPPSP